MGIRLYAMTVLCVLISVGAVAASEIQLPPPQKTGGKPLFEAIDQRASAVSGNFPKGDVPLADLSTILWAASGTNRNGKLWTVPLAAGQPPYCTIYVTNAEGVYRYDWKNHSLVEISKESVHAEIPLQQFARKAPVNLYVVVDGKILNTIDNPYREEFGLVLAGGMSQNIYLAAQGVGVGTRLVYSIKREAASKAFRLSDIDTPLFAMVLGKY